MAEPGAASAAEAAEGPCLCCGHETGVVERREDVGPFVWGCKCARCGTQTALGFSRKDALSAWQGRWAGNAGTD